MFKNIDYYIFDLDGTLIDSQWIYNEIDSELITKNGGIPKETINEDRINFFAQHHHLPDMFDEYMRYIKKTYTLNISIEALYNFRNELCKVYQRDKVKLKPQADIFLKELKRQNKQLFLATISRKDDVNIYLYENKKINDKCNLLSIFGSNILTQDDVEKKKPNPEIYLKALDILQAKASECIVFEDSSNGVKAAKNAGLKVIAVYDRYSDFNRDEINALADYKVTGYDELIYQYRKTKRS